LENAVKYLSNQMLIQIQNQINESDLNRNVIFISHFCLAFSLNKKSKV